MVDLAIERENAIQLVINEYVKLRKMNPEHSLLKYIDSIDDDGFTHTQNDRLLDLFVKKYAPDNNTPVAVMYTKYYCDLKKTAQKYEKASFNCTT